MFQSNLSGRRVGKTSISQIQTLNRKKLTPIEHQLRLWIEDVFTTDVCQFPGIAATYYNTFDFSKKVFLTLNWLYVIVSLWINDEACPHRSGLTASLGSKVFGWWVGSHVCSPVPPTMDVADTR